MGAVRYRAAERHVVHLLNYAYDEARDAVSPASALRVTVPWHGAPPVACTLVGLEGEQAAECEAGDGLVSFEVPELELFAVAVLRDLGA